MAIYITNDDVRNLLSMEAAVDVLDDLFRQEAAGLVENIARKRRRFEGGGSGTLMGGVVLGSKAYGVRNSNHSLLHDTDTGVLQAVIEPSEVAWIRTGAASGVATKYMASSDAMVVGCVGTGHQAITQLRAMCAVRPISLIKVYSRSQEGRDAFVKQMAIDKPSIEIVAVDSTEACLAGSQIVVGITNSRTPVFDGALLEPGTHVNAAGGNSYARCEIDDVTIARSSVIAVDNLDQAKMECGELIAAADRGVFRWGQAVELHQVVSGQVAGRPSPDAITLFESQGIGTEDTACYAYLLRQAREFGIGTELPF
jgi:ornithine cyclodeaminase/alanine dehydrogenase-like protein (mu-crystallin family)